MIAAYDWPAGTIVDVGGGQGALLAAILARTPDVRGVLFDLPHVVAAARELIDEAGLADRCELVGGRLLRAGPGRRRRLPAQRSPRLGRRAREPRSCAAAARRWPRGAGCS